MSDAEYSDALQLLEQATELLRDRDVATQAQFIYELRRLIVAFDRLRIQIGQPPPELQRN